MMCCQQTCRKAGGVYRHSSSADVAIFFLHTRKPLLSPCATADHEHKIRAHRMRCTAEVRKHVQHQEDSGGNHEEDCYVTV
jgi:hypothetical protein